MNRTVLGMPTAPFVLLRRNQERVAPAVTAGRYDAVWECRRNCFDEIVAFTMATGVFDLLDRLEVDRERAGIPDPLVIRTLLTSVLLGCHSIRQIPTVLFGDPGVLRFLGFTVRQVEDGFNKRGNPDKQCPFSHETIYDLWPRMGIESVVTVAGAYSGSLIASGLVRGTTYVIDCSSLLHSKTRQMFLPLVNIRGGREVVVAYRLLAEKASELTHAKELVREALATGAQIKQLILDRAYIDGVWMQELKEQGIDVLVQVKEDMAIFQDLLGFGRAKGAAWRERQVTRKIEGRQVRYHERVLLVGALESW